MSVADEIKAERIKQDDYWGGPKHDDQHIHEEWVDYIITHARHSVNGRDFRYQMIRVAALAIAAIESDDRLAAKAKESK